MSPAATLSAAPNVEASSATIVVDARKLRDFGIGSYIGGLIRGIAELGDQREFVLLIASEADGEQLPILPSNARCVVESAPGYSLREQFSVSAALRRENAQLYHATHYVLPMRLPCPAVVTIHDLIHLLYPEFLPNRAALIYANTMLRRAVRKAAHVVAVSENTRTDLVQRLDAPPDQIAVIHNGVDEAFFVDDRSGSHIDDALDRLRLKRGYLLFVGNPKPHKNLDRVLQTFRVLCQNRPDLQLVIVGASAERARLEQQAGSLGIERSIRILRFVAQQDLPAVYAGAAVLLCPGLYEGFGLPVAEAMAAGTPVVTSNTSALAEVAGDAARLVDPQDVEAIARATSDLLADGSAAAALAAKGQQRAIERFRWRRAAAATLAIYDRALERASA